MSHRAIVAIQTGENRYDMHYSANGAYELQLTNLLEEHIAEKSGDWSEIPEDSTAQVPQIEKWNAMDVAENDPDIQAWNADSPPMDREPLASGVPLEHIGAPVEYDNIEAFYVVRNGAVSTYVPVWLEPNVLRPWREHLSVEAYNAGKLSSDPRELVDSIEEREPIRVLDSDLFERNWYDDSVASTIIREHHEAIYALQRQMADQQDEPNQSDEGSTQSPETVQGFLSLDSFMCLVSGPSSEAITPDPTGRGLLIRIPNYDYDAYRSVTDDAAHKRVSIAAGLNAISEVTDEDRSEATKDLLIELLEAYHGDIAPFSPPPYGEIAHRIAQKMGPSGQAQ